MGIKLSMQGNIYLDANIFIYLLEGYADFTAILQQLMDFIDSGKLQSFTSELSLAEALVKPIRDKNLALQSLYESTIQTTSSLIVCSINRDILIQAAKFRANSTNNIIRLPDAIHLVTAQVHQCQYFITNDVRLKNSFADMDVLLLSDIKTHQLELV
jgi:predicted nucleic acid-binding protein